MLHGVASQAGKGRLAVLMENGSGPPSGGNALWSNFSDYRVKPVIQDLEKGVELTETLRPVSFKIKNGSVFAEGAGP